MAWVAYADGRQLETMSRRVCVNSGVFARVTITCQPACAWEIFLSCHVHGGIFWVAVFSAGVCAHGARRFADATQVSGPQWLQYAPCGAFNRGLQTPHVGAKRERKACLGSRTLCEACQPHNDGFLRKLGFLSCAPSAYETCASTGARFGFLVMRSQRLLKPAPQQALTLQPVRQARRRWCERWLVVPGTSDTGSCPFWFGVERSQHAARWLVEPGISDMGFCPFDRGKKACKSECCAGCCLAGLW